MIFIVERVLRTMLARALFPDSTIPLLVLLPVPVVSSRQLTDCISWQNSEEFARLLSSSTLMNRTVYPMDRMVFITHLTVSMGGVLALPGKPRVYEVEPHVMSSADVNPRIEVTPKKEKSMCNLSNGRRCVLFTGGPLGSLVVLFFAQTKHVQLSLCNFNEDGISVSRFLRRSGSNDELDV
jgi:hypothetical protein